MAETTPETWGVSVTEVKALAPHITITNTAPTMPGDAPWEGNKQRHVTETQVTGWIVDVAARVSLRIHRRARIQDATMTATITGMAHDLTLNGAGSYMVAAAFPAKAGTNDNTNYSSELWRRFTTGLDELEKAIEEWLTDNPSTAPGGSIGDIVSSFPEPRFTDDIVW